MWKWLGVFFGTKPKGEEMKLEKGKVVKGPAILPAIRSVSSLASMSSVLCRADLWLEGMKPCVSLGKPHEKTNILVVSPFHWNTG